ncbi:uncharacterized protein LOC133298041 [Gastrolobium bilobum]|uniref:uncharacterized protein LOC133298041 n=1 Tax=Gastrolobium bilobum TaxID=150636 RepID=UPI002AB1CCFB|nr:uncharacterized protein LOC133298041 [Gastrolobium bilobum]
MAEETQKSKKHSNHTWTAEEDKVLVDCLLEIGLSWKGDNNFRPSFASHLEKMIQAKIPSCPLKANPHTTSRIKLLKKHYNAICEMIGPNSGSGFGWNDKTHPNVEGLYKKPFPFFDELGPIFGRDVASGQDAEGPEDAVEELKREVVMFNESGNFAYDFYGLIDDTTQA